MAKTQPVQRRYQWLDSISQARRASDVRDREREIRSMEASMNAHPINPGGFQDSSRAYMQSQVMDQIADRREQIRYRESLSGDDLVRHYCANEIAQHENPGPDVDVTLNGEPLARGATGPFAPPGFPR